ncbi:MAG: SsrA-binding protein SmpB [Phototrophicaceae bacterium]|jgi:SsrA-binding protein
MTDAVKVISRNRKAFHEYEISERFEAGLVLMGSEIKSIRGNRVNLGEGFVVERGNELWLMHVHIAPYAFAEAYGHSDPMRPRKLLLHRREISKVRTWIRENTYTAVPISLYLKNGRAKVEIGLARGKKLYDKRNTIAERDSNRQIQRALKENY